LINKLKKISSSFPNNTGIYKFLSDSEILYIGKAKNLKKRINSYFSGKQTYKTQKLISCATSLEYVTTNNEVEALLLEQNLIKSEKPKFNILLRDDKSYPFIHLDETHTFPRIASKRVLKRHDGLYGPYTNAHATKIAVNQIQKVFQLRTCTDNFFRNRSRPCMEHQIGRCTAPCVGLISKADYRKDVENAKSILKGNLKKLEKSMQNEMFIASDKEEYELAGNIRNRLEHLEKINQKQIIFSKGSNTRVISIKTNEKNISAAVIQIESDRFINIQKFLFKNHLQKDDYSAFLEFIPSLIQKYSSVTKIISEFDVAENDTFGNVRFEAPKKGKKLEWLKLADKNALEGLLKQEQKHQKYVQSLDFLARNIGIKKNPSIVGFDVSGISGDIKTISCVNFTSDGPNKSLYRFFRVPIDISSSDLDSLVFGVNKYLDLVDSIDLLLIDGGKTHMNYVKERLKKDIECISVSKGAKRKYGFETLHTRIGSYDFQNSEDISKLFLDIRDEAHRFALKNFKSNKRKNLKKHFLFDIKGVGPKTVQKIYQKYTSLRSLARLSDLKISKDLNIKLELAKEIQSLIKELYN
tara:strand:- start:21 stop:1766 length:1746 start_codon:yes stop_codon:yes gene_type:complete